MKEADVKTAVEVADQLPAEARTVRRNAAKKSAIAKEPVSAKTIRTVLGVDDWPEETKPAKKSAGTGRGSAGTGAKKAKGRSKARSGSEKLTPAALYRKMIAFGKNYQVEKEQDFIEAARIYAEEAGLIDQMRDRIAEDGLTVEKTYKTGSVEVAHPLLSELPRHVESANKCLATIGTMIGERGAKKQKPTRELDQFRLNA